MDQRRLNIARDGVQKSSAERLLSFQGLKPSSALELQSYDIDHFGDSERYAGASSMPLSAGTTAIMRARLSSADPEPVAGEDLPADHSRLSAGACRRRGGADGSCDLDPHQRAVDREFDRHSEGRVRLPGL